MSKIPFDKYYTPSNLAQKVIDKTQRQFPEITEFLEPSAGAGAFSSLLPGCLAFDILPEAEGITRQDFLSLQLPYKAGRCIIGNPPFGERNALIVQFYKKAVSLGDYIAFILPISQLNNQNQLYEFPLVYSAPIPTMAYSGVELDCCLNLYQRDPEKLHSKPSYLLEDVEVGDCRRGGTDKSQVRFDYAFCAWGNGTMGREVSYLGQYAFEIYLICKTEEVREKVVSLCKTTDWQSLVTNISAKKIVQWQVLQYLKREIPELRMKGEKK